MSSDAGSEVDAADSLSERVPFQFLKPPDIFLAGINVKLERFEISPGLDYTSVDYSSVSIADSLLESAIYSVDVSRFDAVPERQ